MTFYPGQIQSNFVSTLCDGCASAGSTGDFGVFTSGTTHVVIDLIATLGTTSDTDPHALDCSTLTNSFNIPASGASGAYFTVVSPNCAAGYSVTGGGLNTNFSSSNLHYYNSSPSPLPTPTARAVRG